MNLSRLLELLREFDLPRPDSSGIRGKGAQRKPDTRLSNFPYDRDTAYGQPAPYDRGSSGGSNLNHPLTPSDDQGFSLTLLGMKNDPDVDEATGTPMLLSKGGTSQLGGTVPGTSAWASDPPKQWDEGDMDEDPFTRSDVAWGANEDDFVDPMQFGHPDAHVIAPDPWSVINQRLSSRGLYGMMPRESSWDRVSGMVLKKRKIS